MTAAQADYFLVDSLQELLYSEANFERKSQLPACIQKRQEVESTIRKLFATDRDHPDLLDNHLLLVDIYAEHRKHPERFLMDEDCPLGQIELMFAEFRQRRFVHSSPGITTSLPQFQVIH